MRRPDPDCSLVRAEGILVPRKVAACQLDAEMPWGSPGVKLRPLDAARVFTSGTELDPRDLLAFSRNMTAAVVAGIADGPPADVAMQINGALMDAIALGYHARKLEQDSGATA